MPALPLDKSPYSIDLDSLVARVVALETGGGPSTLTAAKTLTAAQSGSTFLLGTATGFAVTLPAPFAGGRFTFIVNVAPSGGNYTIVGASGTPIHGMALSPDLNGATDAATTAGTGVLTITLVSAKAMKGDTVYLYSDGVAWFARIYTGGAFDAATLS